MKDDEFYELGIQAGFMDWELDDGTTRSFDPRYIRFAKLVAAKEREACAKVCEDGLNIATSLQALDDMEIWGEKFAKAIRARGEA